MTRRTKKHTKRHRRRRGGGIIDSVKGFFGYAPAPTAPILPAVAAAPVEVAKEAEKALPPSINSDAQAKALGLSPGGTTPSDEQVLGTGGRRRRSRRRKTRRTH
jgi:hypothetical protein